MTMESIGTMPIWATILISLVGGGGLTTILLALLGKIKTSHDKGIEISGILRDFEDKLMESNRQFKDYCDETIARLKEDNSELRMDKLELKDVITSANDCEYLKANPSKGCVVIDADRQRYKKKVQCRDCEHKDECDGKDKD